MNTPAASASDWGTPPGLALDDEIKRRFADALLKNPSSPLEAATLVWPDNMGAALWASQFLPQDPAVIVAMHKLQDENPDAYLPTKEQTARRIWEWTERGRAPSKEHIEAMRLYCDMQGFILKPIAGANGNSKLVPPKIVFTRRADPATSN